LITESLRLANHRPQVPQLSRPPAAGPMPLQ